MLEYESENTDLNEIREKVKREDAERTEGEKALESYLPVSRLLSKKYW